MKLNILKTLFLTAFPMAFLQPSFAANYPWTNATSSPESASGSYHFYYQKQRLQDVLQKLASNYNIKLNPSSSLDVATLNKSVSGNFDVKTPTDLLNTLAATYGFSWFYYSNTLYVTSNKTTSSVVYISPESMTSIKNILYREDLLNDQFGWTEMPSESRVIVSGPREYVDLVLERVRKLNVSPINQQFAVYRLKYASAVDTTINLSNQKIVIPGVATLLQSILGNPSASSSTANNKMLAKVIEPLKNEVEAIKSMKSTLDAEDQGQGTGYRDTKITASTPLIQADNRLNTIIIRDKATNLKLYKALIDMLDVPAPLIQVEAMIIDFDQYKLNEAGISWWGSKGNVSGGYNTNKLSSSGSSSGLAASFGNVSPSNLVVSNVGGFLASLQFLETNGIAKAESKSGVVTIDNLAAAINLTESFYTQGSGGTGPNASNQVQTNMTMLITPHVINDNDGKKIKLIIALQDGNIEEKVVNNMPTTIQGSINTQAVIGAGQGLLIAGYSRMIAEKSTNQVPVLGSIPIVGWLFKNSSVKDRKFQRTYLITPKIVWEGKRANQDSFEESENIFNSVNSRADKPQKSQQMNNPFQLDDSGQSDNGSNDTQAMPSDQNLSQNDEQSQNAQKFIDMISSGNPKAAAPQGAKSKATADAQ